MTAADLGKECLTESPAVSPAEPLDRGAGILMPVSSLPSPYGIGTMGQAALDFIDRLSAAGQRYWQVLPLGPTGYGDSPYQAFSAFAGNPYFIDPDLLVRDGLLTEEEIRSFDWGEDPSKIDYGKIYGGRFELFRKAYARWTALRTAENTAEYERFQKAQEFWLEDYALYMACKKESGGLPWTEWEDGLRLRDPEALDRFRAEHESETGYWKFLQFIFCGQWKNVRTYAGSRGIRLIGDMPLYVALDSADCWSRSRYFQTDRQTRLPREVAGVPPDAFSEDGQLWGNPLYDWDEMERDGFRWWKERIRANAELYDAVRIDHFIGTVQYYAIPVGGTTAKNGTYRKGPGAALFKALLKELEGTGTKIIAEDLGVYVPEVEALLRQFGFPGMKVLEFAFGGDRKNPHLPMNYTENCICYGGTHDNETMAGYFLSGQRPWWEMQYLKDYLGVTDENRLMDMLFRAGYGSVASVVIFQMQDVLGLDNRARMNTPGTFGDNWCWRMLPGAFTDERVGYLAGLADIYGRKPQ